MTARKRVTGGSDCMLGRIGLLGRMRVATSAMALGVALGVSASASAQSGPSAYTTGYRWDVADRVVGQISPSAAAGGVSGPFLATRYSYNADGQLTTIETGSLSSWQAETVLPSAWSGFTLFQTVTLTYDAVGNKVDQRVTTAAGGTAVQAATQTSYDAADRPLCTVVRMNLASIPAIGSDACALGTAGADGPDRITKTIYDAAGETVQVRKAVGTSSEQAYVTYSYTPNGKQKFVIDANGNRARLAYDGFDRQSQWYFPSATLPAAFDPSTQITALLTAGAFNTGDYEQYGYDANSNRTSLRKRDGATLTFVYDALNRMVQKRVPDSTGGPNATATANCYSYTSDSNDICYDYDLRGAQLSARFGAATGEGLTEAYDNAGRLSSATTNQGGTSRMLAYQYDLNGNRIRVTHPDNIYFTYDHDGLDRPTTIKDNSGTQIALVTYDAQGRRSGSTRGGVSTTFDYDTASRLWKLHDDLTGTLQDVTATFIYTPASQMKSRARDNDAYSFGGADLVNLSRTYTKNGLNQYTAAGAATPQYDLNGNLTSDGMTSYGYDAENRLLTATTPGTPATVVALAWDPMGRLYQTSGGSVGTTRFLYDGDELVAEYGASGNLLRRYVHGTGADDPMFWYEGSDLSDRRSLQADYLGSIISVADSSGASLRVNTYDEYGIPGTNNLGRFQYTGQAWIPELAMYHYKARIYSPTLGRFLQTDPVGYKDQMNLYAYVGNDPIDGRDPSGLYVCKGSITNCDQIKADLQTISDALKSNKISKSEKAEISSVLKFYGAENKVNGVTIQFATPAQVAKDSRYAGDTAFTTGDKTHAKIELTDRYTTLWHGYENAPHRPGARINTDVERISTLVHEGRHGLQFQGGMTLQQYWNNRDFYEKQGRDTGAIIDKAFGADPHCSWMSANGC